MGDITVLLNPSDNVAVAQRDMGTDETIRVQIEDTTYIITLREDITFSHESALHDIKEGEEILKYGLPRCRSQQTHQARNP